MLHVDKELLAYTISFLLLFAGAFFYLRRSILNLIDEKVSDFQNFFSLTRYLQNISMRLIMQEKQKKDELNEVLTQIRVKAEKDIQKFEQNSRNEINEQVKKWKDHNTQRMRKINTQFANDIKTETVDKIMHQLVKALNSDVECSKNTGFEELKQLNYQENGDGRR